MDINQLYPSDYLKAADLQGRDVTVTIERIEVVTMTDGQPKPCVYFKGKQKGLLLNKTNAMNIASLYGPNTDGWVGQPIVLGTSWVDFQGKSVEAIRVRPKRVQPQDHQAPAQPQQRQAPAASSDDYLDDAIPF